jgi:hypothetical protein
VVFLVYLEVQDRTVVHLVLQIVLSHEAGDQVPQVLLGDADLVGNVGDHQPSHLFGVGEGTA